MKKLISAISAAAVLASCAAISVSAKGAENFTAGNGYLIDDINASVLVENTPDGVQVTHGGYYIDGVNWGGVAYNTPLSLDGLDVSIRIDEIPNYTTDDDCWFSVCFLSQPQLFQVGNYSANPGISNLLRFNYESPTFQEWGPDDWSYANGTEADFFALKKGDILNLSVTKTGDATYQLVINGEEMNNEYDLSDALPNGEAYMVISASFQNSNPDAFKYTVLSINGEPTYEAEAPAATEAPADDVPGEAGDIAADPAPVAPTTGDAGIVAAAALMAVAAGVVLRKKH